MIIQPIPPDNTTFASYQSPLKKAFKAGAFGDEMIGIYGNKVTKNNFSLEHIKPKSKGGRTVLSNLAVADRDANRQRGNDDIAKFVNFEMLRKYLRQFKDIKNGKFNGNDYIKMIRKTFSKMVDEE